MPFFVQFSTKSSVSKVFPHIHGEVLGVAVIVM